MRILSIDVGIKHLAFCLFNYQNHDDYNIEKWGVINLCNDKIYKCCGKNSKKKPCTRAPRYTKKNTYYCKIHAKNKDFKIEYLPSISSPRPGHADLAGADLYEIAEKEGVIDSEKIIQFAEKKLGQGYAGNYPVYVSRSLTKEYVYQQMQAINRRFYLNPIFILKRLKKDMLSFKKLKRDILDMISLLLTGVSRRKPYIIKKAN